MSGNTFGKLFAVTNFGESHGPAIGCVVDGCPPGMELSEQDIQPDLDRRKPGTSRHVTSREEDVFRVSTNDGYEIKATVWHEFYTRRGKLKLSELRVGDELWVQAGKGQFGEQGNESLGMLLGLIAGDGHFTNRGEGREAAVVALFNEDRALA